ncbi:uncharacterized protein TRIVIDRAFT_200243 [Trichoderma virens Gv29-8]|uniref:Uncharacterized protein n=1 Tax=Hypocrea virens (strain Gv29-8 / FGSC 10586) TaxID=413071 RepID=G9MPW9_HYPVG|nr:uncharacterized protein TRIVIDRAFT_200243 [Trichoderma virens Gv29-8]EHK23919.1 hypothetical protein TRIVIDRAFT_200243 [Trichoderma virens Gv29-8]UKZ50224.1 hypothetical protein TrVGV298_004482 [Trichoderma virens]
MADASSTSNAHGFTQQEFVNSTPPSASSGSSSSAFPDTPNEVPREYLMASPSSVLPFAEQGFPFPVQEATSDISFNPLTGFIQPRGYIQKHFQGGYNNQAARVDNDVPSSSSKLPEFGQYSSSARLVREQRLSTCLNILRHIQRTLRQRHEEATLNLARIQRLTVQTTWDLFFQSPLDFMCHEMDILTDATTRAILSEGGDVPQRRSVRDSEDWMRKLDGLRDLRDDEHDAKERVRKILGQMQYADEIMGVGLREQAAALERGDLMAGQYRRAFNYAHQEVEAMASSKGKASATMSAFFNWPLPATSPNGDEASINTGDNSSGSSGQCLSECCRDHSP